MSTQKEGCDDLSKYVGYTFVQAFCMICHLQMISPPILSCQICIHIAVLPVSGVSFWYKLWVVVGGICCVCVCVGNTTALM